MTKPDGGGSEEKLDDGRREGTTAPPYAPGAGVAVGWGMNPDGGGGLEDKGTKPEGWGNGMNPDDVGGMLYRGRPWPLKLDGAGVTACSYSGWYGSGSGADSWWYGWGGWGAL